MNTTPRGLTRNQLTSESKAQLRKTVRGLRESLIAQLKESAEQRYLLSLPPAKASATLSAAALARRRRLDDALDQAAAEVGGGKDAWARAFEDAAKEAGATLLNRLVLLRHLEALGLSKPAVVCGGWMSKGYREFQQVAPALCEDETQGMAPLLELLFAELAVALPGLFGDVGLTSLFDVPPATLREVIEALDALPSEAWRDDLTLGWVYQYWNDPDREALDAKIAASGKIEPHEIASKTQMFTERYMVEWLLQNSLGPTWLAICRAPEAKPLQREVARKIVRQRLEGFLGRHAGAEDLGPRLRGQQLSAGLRFASIAKEGTYQLVVGDPPYQGMSKMKNARYVAKHYPMGKSDLYAAFLERGLQLCRPGGASAMVTMRSWMFLSGFTALREHLLKTFDLRILGDVDRGAFEESLIALGRDADGPGFDQDVLKKLDEHLAVHTKNEVPQDFVRVVRTIFELKQKGQLAEASGLLSWLSGSQNVASSTKKRAGIKGEIQSTDALHYLRGILAIVKGAGYAGLVIVIDEAETILRMKSDVRATFSSPWQASHKEPTESVSEPQPSSGMATPPIVRGKAAAIETALSRWRTYRGNLRLQNLLLATFQSLPDGTVVVDADGRIAFLNLTAERVLGLHAAEAIGREVHEIIRRADSGKACCAEQLASVLAGGPTATTPVTSLIRRDGTHVPVHATLSPLVSDGAVSGAVLVLRPVERP